MRYSEILENLTTSSISGTYVSAHFTDDTLHRLADFAHDLEIPNVLDQEDFHTTIVYSRKPINWRDATAIDEKAKPVEWHVWDTQDKKKCLVLRIDSDYLNTRFETAMARGATYDFEDYKPHISFSYNVGEDFDVVSLPLPDFDLVIDHEVSKSLDTGWLKNNNK